MVATGGNGGQATEEGDTGHGQRTATRVVGGTTSETSQFVARRLCLANQFPNTPWVENMHTLTPLAPPQLIGKYGSPMECLGYIVLLWFATMSEAQDSSVEGAPALQHTPELSMAFETKTTFLDLIEW